MAKQNATSTKSLVLKQDKCWITSELKLDCSKIILLPIRHIRFHSLFANFTEAWFKCMYCRCYTHSHGMMDAWYQDICLCLIDHDTNHVLYFPAIKGVLHSLLTDWTEQSNRHHPHLSFWIAVCGDKTQDSRSKWRRQRINDCCSLVQSLFTSTLLHTVGL